MLDKWGYKLNGKLSVSKTDLLRSNRSTPDFARHSGLRRARPAEDRDGGIRSLERATTGEARLELAKASFHYALRLHFEVQ